MCFALVIFYSTGDRINIRTNVHKALSQQVIKVANKQLYWPNVTPDIKSVCLAQMCWKTRRISIDCNTITWSIAYTTSALAPYDMKNNDIFFLFSQKIRRYFTQLFRFLFCVVSNKKPKPMFLTTKSTSRPNNNTPLRATLWEHSLSMTSRRKNKHMKGTNMKENYCKK